MLTQTPIKIFSNNHFSSTVTVLCDKMPCNINVSDASASVIFRVENKLIMFPQNLGISVPKDNASHSRRQRSLHSNTMRNENLTVFMHLIWYDMIYDIFFNCSWVDTRMQ
jgi:hypothetical protein